jgi:hypothetical protein
MPRKSKREPQTQDDRIKTSLVISEELLHRLKVAAAEERIAEGVSGLLCRIAEEWLSKRRRA